MKLEIVTHCWNYARLLTYQLSSFVLYPPKRLCLTVTVFHNEADQRTCEALGYFATHQVPNITWNWRNIEQGQLFRRAIGRNMAALSNRADWVWFTDCDQVFHEGCLDALPEQAEECDSPLLYPRYVNICEHLDSQSSIFAEFHRSPCLMEIDVAHFFPSFQPRAIGALQIVRGDVARQVGYCKDIPKYMKPASRWQKTYEDVKFRKTLGTNGTPIDLPGLFRIEHKAKGRKRFHAAKL